MNTIYKIFITLFALTTITYVSPATAESRTLSNVLGQIDKQLLFVEGATATATLTKVVSGKPDEVSTGKFYSNREDAVRIDFDSPATRTVLINENTFFDYAPAAKTTDKWSVGKAPQGELRFINLGFGVSGSDLDRDYIVTLLESAKWETLQTTVLALTPKQSYLRDQAWSILLRLDESNWLPVQQIIRYGDSQTQLNVVYSGGAKNNNLSSKEFKPNWPSGTKTTAH